MSRSRRRKKGNFALRFFQKIVDLGFFILIVLAFTYLMSNYIVERVVVKNHSMEATLDDGDHILVDKISYILREPKRFEVVVFKQNGTGEELIKRIIGLPGETVVIKNGVIYINGSEIDDYEGLTPPMDAGIASSHISLGPGEYFVLGDNREVSVDSRSEEVGNVTNTRMIGRALIRIYPFDKIGLITGGEEEQ